MEKFRKWGDAATGINPFVYPADTLPAVTRIVQVWLLFPVRLALAVILLLLLFILWHSCVKFVFLSKILG